VRRKTFDEKTPVAVSGLLVTVRVRVGVVSRTSVVMGRLGAVGMAMGPGATVTEPLAATVKGLHDAAPHGLATRGGRLIDVERSDEDLVVRGPDQLNRDAGNGLDKSVADLDDPEFDANDLHHLLLIEALGLDGEAVAKCLRALVAIALDHGSGQVAVPGVGVRVQLEAVEGEPGAVLDGEVHLQVSVSAPAFSAREVEALGEGGGGEFEGLDVGVDGECVDGVLVGDGYVGHDQERSGRRRESELAEEHGYWCRIRLGDVVASRERKREAVSR
jgi:hypothetical protein